MNAHDLLKNLTSDEADAYGLVLSSSRIPYHVSRGDQGWDIYIHSGLYEQAVKAIEAYLEENEDADPIRETDLFEYGKTFTGIWVPLLLVALHVAIVMSHNSQALIKIYGSAAQHILHGELYRTVTSLMIHVNALHLVGNIFGIALFGTAVCQVMGPGVGWFMILVTGIGGNFMNALLYQSDHLSVGSSTAIFGAIGILAGYQFLKRFRRTNRGTKAWLPLGAGVALLAFLGSSKYSDLTAHLFGLLAGIPLGAFYGFIVKRPAGKVYQGYCVLAALILIVTAWMRGFGA
ncbi:MAG: rhomboid family intramembrane serine protease [Desulfobacterales bacterium]|nr:MAG: rhomboid family intramembrane serine protease [Desulfobacterales bacterium]